jgi:hypothetical protein
MLKPLTGFQKSAVRASQRQLKAEQARVAVPVLNPAFPYAVESFDISYFNIPANPEGKKS